MLSKIFKRALRKFKLPIAPGLVSILSTSLISQVATLAISIIRIPISLHFFRIHDYGVIIIFLTYWQIVVIFGESNRKVWRMLRSFQGSMPILTFNIKTLIWYLSITASASIIFWLIFGIIGFIMSNIVAGAGLIYLKYSPYCGILELNGFYSKVNWFFLMSNLLLIAPWYFSCRIGSSYLYLITVCASFPLFSYLCKRSCIRGLKVTSVKVNQQQHGDSNFGNYLFLALISKSTYLIDPFIIQAQIGETQVVIHSIYQKFLTLFSITPTALTPLFMVESAKNRISEISKQGEKYLVLITIFKALVIFILADKVFNFLSGGKISSSNYLIGLVLVQGIIGSVTTKIVQASNLRQQLSLRLKIGTIGTTLSALATYLLLPVLGISISFLTSILYSFSTFYFLKKIK